MRRFQEFKVGAPPFLGRVLLILDPNSSHSLGSAQARLTLSDSEAEAELLLPVLVRTSSYVTASLWFWEGYLASNKVVVSFSSAIFGLTCPPTATHDASLSPKPSIHRSAIFARALTECNLSPYLLQTGSNGTRAEGPEPAEHDGGGGRRRYAVAGTVSHHTHSAMSKHSV